MRICSKCSIKKDETDFYVKDKKSGRLHTQCKECYRKYRVGHYTKHYAEKQEFYKARAKVYRLKVRKEFHDNMLAYLKDKYCVLCGEQDVRTFEFDHIDPKEKKFSVSQAVRLGYRWEAVILEIQKCRILCANCHKKHTASQFSWYKI